MSGKNVKGSHEGRKNTVDPKNVINVDLATVNPLFKMNSHLPNGMQHYLAKNEIKKKRKQRETVIQDIHENNQNTKCFIISFKKKSIINQIILCTLICWVIFFTFSLTDNTLIESFITQTPIAYMFASFQFTLFLIMCVNRHFKVRNIEKKRVMKWKLFTLAFLLFAIIFVCGIEQSDWTNWSSANVQEEEVEIVKQNYDTGDCVIIDNNRHNLMKSQVMLNNNRNIPYAIQSFSKNISIEQIDSIFYNLAQCFANNVACKQYDLQKFQGWV
jgi:hypothetical protein